VTVQTTTEIERYRTRVEAARRRLAGLPREDWGQLGPADAQTGERWDRGHVLGHLAEMLPYWTGQVRLGLAGGGALGRDEAGWAHRRQGIDQGRAAGVEGLLVTVDEGVGSLLTLLDELRPADLDRPLATQGHLRDREQVDVRWAVEQMLIGHLEAHLHQLDETA
jgi:hypothetical protein